MDTKISEKIQNLMHIKPKIKVNQVNTTKVFKIINKSSFEIDKVIQYPTNEELVE